MANLQKLAVFLLSFSIHAFITAFYLFFYYLSLLINDAPDAPNWMVNVWMWGLLPTFFAIVCCWYLTLVYIKRQWFFPAIVSSFFLAALPVGQVVLLYATAPLEHIAPPIIGYYLIALDYLIPGFLLGGLIIKKNHLNWKTLLVITAISLGIAITLAIGPHIAISFR